MKPSSPPEMLSSLISPVTGGESPAYIFAKEESPTGSRSATQPGNLDSRRLHTAASTSGAGGEEGLPEDEAKAEAAGEENDRGGLAMGNRWPRQETLALLKIRLDMDAAFRDATLKGPLWEEISRKMEELGFVRSAKKCKEKFENVEKYYKRKKEGRIGRQNGKNYRFFSQLEALHGGGGGADGGDGGYTALLPPSPSPFRISLSNAIGRPIAPQPISSVGPPSNASSSTSSSSDGEDTEETAAPDPPGSFRKRKHGEDSENMVAFFEGFMKQVMERQEAMQQKFLDALEKREKDWIVREEAWKRSEMARINHEQELLAKERAMAASRDATIISFLQKLTGKPMAMTSTAPPPPSMELITAAEISPEAPARWPKAEVHTLIVLRSELESRYQEMGPKGPLWEEISSEMKRLGIDRSAKRCKEKWENINKYFKKVKESNKKRPEGAKTCPYYHQLDALCSKKFLGGIAGAPANSKEMPLAIIPPPQAARESFLTSVGSDSNKVKEMMVDQHLPDGRDDYGNLDDEHDGEEENFEEDERKIQYEIHFQRPNNLGGGGSSGNPTAVTATSAAATSFFPAMVHQ